MGINNKVLVLASVVALGFSACKKKDETPAPVATTTTTTPPAATLNGSMTAKIDGADWTSIKNSGMVMTDQANSASALVLNGETATTFFALGIDFPTSSSTLIAGNHDQNGSKDDVVFTYATKTSGGGTVSQHIVDKGNFNITSVDNANKKVSGTFDFVLHKIGASTAADTMHITNGVFTGISYTIVNQ